MRYISKENNLHSEIPVGAGKIVFYMEKSFLIVEDKRLKIIYL